MIKSLLSAALLVALTGPVAADPALVQGMTTEKTGMGWRVSVTLRHPDTGWEHYTDAWRIETADGKVLGTRELLHPHVHEQPFTRSLSSVMVPDGTSELHVRARCTFDGWSTTTRVFAFERGS